MPDREKVIKGLEACLDEADCTKCYKDGPGFGYACRESLMRDALVTLKEQEARKPDCEHAEHDGVGCLGYAGCSQDDEPIEACKECDAYTGNRTERR